MNLKKEVAGKLGQWYDEAQYIEIVARRAAEALLPGQYRALAKGRGIAFESTRQYQDGDDPRRIDWRVTARKGVLSQGGIYAAPYIKEFEEEHELTVLLLVDCSASLLYGSGVLTKLDVAIELAALLAISGIRNNDKVGLFVLSGTAPDLVVPPRKGRNQVVEIIASLLRFREKRVQTDLASVLESFVRLRMKRCLVFLISDFMNEEFQEPLAIANRKHDIVALTILDPLEEVLPDLGLVNLTDAESGRNLLLDSSSKQMRKVYSEAARQRTRMRREALQMANVPEIVVYTHQSPLEALVKYFRKMSSHLMFLVVAAFWLLAGFESQQALAFDTYAYAEIPEIRAGKAAKIILVAELPEDYVLDYPEFTPGSVMGGMLVGSSAEFDIKESTVRGKRKIEMSLILRSFERGVFRFPAQVLSANLAGDRVSSETNPVYLAFQGEDGLPKLPELVLDESLPTLRSNPPRYALLLFALVGMLGSAVMFLAARRQPSPALPVYTRCYATETLARIRDEILLDTAADTRAKAYLLSEILRRYLALEFNALVLAHSTTEIQKHIDHLTVLKTQSLLAVLERLDVLKFAEVRAADSEVMKMISECVEWFQDQYAGSATVARTIREIRATSELPESAP
jgi:uncharacterized protein (DUF58 family)